MTDDDSRNLLPFSTNRQMRDSVAAALQSAATRPELRRHLKMGSRFAVENRIVTACFEHPGGGLSNAEVMLINLDADGAAIVFGGYMHPSTTITMMLPNHTDEQVPLSGTITYCDYLFNKYHAINIQWHRPVDPRDFVEPSQWIGQTSTESAQDHQTLSGRILYLHSEKMELKLFEMMLADTKIDVVWASDLGQAIDALHRDPFDVVYVDAGNHRSKALDDIVKIRSEVHRGPILIGIQDGNQSHVKELRRLGYKHFIQKPFEKQKLLSALRASMSSSDDPAGGTSPIYSTIEISEQSCEWIQEFVSNAQQLAKTLNMTIMADDAEQALVICGQLHSTGVGYGFPLVSEVASEAVTVLNASCSAKESRRELMRLVAVLGRLHVKQTSMSGERL